MQSFGIYLLAALTVGGVFAAIKAIGSTAERSLDQHKHQNKINNSSGIEKAQLLLRDDAMSFAACGGWINIPTSHVYIDIIEYYYTLLKNEADKVKEADDGLWSATLDAFGEEISSDRKTRQLIAARIYGIAFGIILAKTANLYNKKIHKTSVKRYCEACKLDELRRKEIYKMALVYIDFEQDELSGAKSKYPVVNHNLGKMAYALFDEKLGEKEDADISYKLFMNTAVSLAYKDAQTDEIVLRNLEEEGLIF